MAFLGWWMMRVHHLREVRLVGERFAPGRARKHASERPREGPAACWSVATCG